MLAKAPAVPTSFYRESLMCDKHLLPTIVRLRLSHSALPLEGPRCRAGLVVTAQFGVVQEVPHEPDLRNTEAVNDHQFPVETGVESLKVRRCRRSGDSEGPKALVT